MYFLSPIDIGLLVIAFIISMYAQMKVKSTFAKYNKVRSRRGITGAEVAQRILLANNIHDVTIEETNGLLSDHYDPIKRKLRLSSENFHSTSVASLGVAAHETGHAIQHHVSYAPLKWRHSIFPVANLGSNLAFPFFFIGLIFSSGFLMDVGIYFFLAAVAFQLITLPVEFDASRRALAILESGGFLERDEIGGARKVLRAAALTYVAATAVAIMQLVRLLLIRGASDN
ncbi:MAG: zinc metallopeptidase [Calditrichaeota bacterium]|nr:zinc metallopeptidase [Calditrichota bacterium]